VDQADQKLGMHYALRLGVKLTSHSTLFY